MEMKMEMMIVMATTAAMHACLLVSIANADLGTATYYNPPYVPSACHGYKDDMEYVAGASLGLWNHSRACGKFYEVKCIPPPPDRANPCNGMAVAVQIVDRCGRGCRGTINLSLHAFRAIADTRAGVINIEYSEMRSMFP